MLISLLDSNLPTELSDMIFKHVKDQFNKDLKFILENRTVWIIHKNKLSFLILEKNKNYYDILNNLDNDNNFKKIEKRKRFNF